MKLPKLADIETELTQSDGRLYDLCERDGVLTLQLRRRVIWERSLVLALIVLFYWMLSTVLSYRSWHSSPNKINIYFEILKESGMALLIYLGWHTVLIAAQSWILDKTGNKIRVVVKRGEIL